MPDHEIGGTIGDIEGLPFTEAMRQFATEVGKASRFVYSYDLTAQSPGSRRTQDQTPSKVLQN